jgi:hypothetical protein
MSDEFGGYADPFGGEVSDEEIIQLFMAELDMFAVRRGNRIYFLEFALAVFEDAAAC